MSGVSLWWNCKGVLAVTLFDSAFIEIKICCIHLLGQQISMKTIGNLNTRKITKGSMVRQLKLLLMSQYELNCYHWWSCRRHYKIRIVHPREERWTNMAMIIHALEKSGDKSCGAEFIFQTKPEGLVWDHRWHVIASRHADVDEEVQRAGSCTLPYKGLLKERYSSHQAVSGQPWATPK